MTDATPAPGVLVSRPAQIAPTCQRVSRSPISSVLLVPSLMSVIRQDDPPSQICSLTAKLLLPNVLKKLVVLVTSAGQVYTGRVMLVKGLTASVVASGLIAL